MYSHRHVCKFIGFFLLLVFSGPGLARVLNMEVDRISTPVARLDALTLSLHWPEGATQGKLRLKAKLLDAGELGYRWRDLDWACDLQQPATAASSPDGWQCSGRIKARGAAGLGLSARLQSEALIVEMSEGQSRIRIRQPQDAGSNTQLELVRVPVAWLAPLLAQTWSDGVLTAGQISADWQVQQDDTSIGLSGPVSLSGLGLDSSDGSIAVAGIKAQGRVQGQVSDTRTALELALDFSGGEVLLGALYAQLPNTPVQMAATLVSEKADQWRIDALRWHDPGVLEVQGKAQLDTAADMPLRQADLRFSLAALGNAHARYFESLAASLGLPGLGLSGSAQGELRWQGGQWHALDLNLKALNAKDGANRFGSEGINGNLRLRQGSEAANSELSWQSAHMHGIKLGAANFALQSSKGGLALRAPLAIPMLGGQLRLNTLRYMPEQDDLRLELAMALEKADLAALSTAFGWPAFSGTISGELPGVRYAAGRMDFDGGLSAQMFDGRVSVSQLSMERPFGVAPILTASISFSGLDLQPLTSAFGFGEITGRLDGHVRDLRLLDWEPVAFDAAFHTVARRGERRRISQRAVRELTEVGGGGLAAGLQAKVLQAFSSFGYERIGLSCLLANNVCTMGGVGPADNGGYIIVDGSGVPRVNVIGHQRRVDWPVLVSRLKAATEGQMPVFD